MALIELLLGLAQGSREGPELRGLDGRDARLGAWRGPRQLGWRGCVEGERGWKKKKRNPAECVSPTSVLLLLFPHILHDLF